MERIIISLRYHDCGDEEPLDEEEDEGKQHGRLVAVILTYHHHHHNSLVAVILTRWISEGPAGVGCEHHHGALGVTNV